VAQQSDVVFTIVGFPADVRETVLGPDGVLAGLAPGGVLVGLHPRWFRFMLRLQQDC
jgi:3-hydroxyisobutyrate dehydrogenase